MMIGSQKLLPVLAVPAEHQGHPLQLDEVKVIGFNVKSNWNAETINQTLENNVKQIGKKPKYIISDNDSKMRKAIELSNYQWHRDISHTLAMFMERVYKEDVEFVNFNKKMTICKQQYCMKEIAYLQSPTQRTKARFMNLSYSVDWADRMLQIFKQLKPSAQEVFKFIPENASFIDEMKEMISNIQYIETEMKHHGLSKKTIEQCQKYVYRTIMRGNERMRKVGQQILDYLTEEKQTLREDEILNNSSDIIESMFGIFKYKQSTNKLNGVTPLVLHLPVILALSRGTVSKNYNIKDRLIRTKIKEIKIWRAKNLLENLVTKRIKTLKRG